VARPHANRWKIGLFVLSGLAAGIGALVWLAAVRGEKTTHRTYTYFDEAVDGLDLGAACTYRGVHIGRVKVISVAPDLRHVAVGMDIDLDALVQAGLRSPHTPVSDAPRLAEFVARGLRTQLSSRGITGLKYISIDFFDPKRHAAAKLDFAPPELYIPATESTTKSVEGAVAELSGELPDLARDVRGLVQRADRTIEEAKIAELSADARKFLGTAESKLAAIDANGLNARSAKLLDETTQATADVRRLAAKLEAAPVDESLDALKGSATEARVALVALEQALAELGAAADSVRRLADLLERDPSAFLRGKGAVESEPVSGR
jgi:ABC-type transporter Mla subunit MlaD